jgi:hypothetical protein
MPTWSEATFMGEGYTPDGPEAKPAERPRLENPELNSSFRSSAAEPDILVHLCRKPMTGTDLVVDRLAGTVTTNDAPWAISPAQDPLGREDENG